MFKRSLATLLLSVPTLSLAAQQVTIPFNGLNLGANLAIAEGSSLSDNIVVLTHGTLAHNEMEIIATLQSLLSDEGINSLAVNLSLGLDSRQGMYDCAEPHQHKHSDAVAELNAWADWLATQGATQPIFAGHSRGGNQTAWFADTYPEKAKAQVLIAPATWSEDDAQESYQKRYRTPLNDELQRAKASDQSAWLDTPGFIYCENARVKAASFVDYYAPNPRFDTPTLLKTASVPTLVISGSEDNTVPDLPEKMPNVDNSHVTYYNIEGADHFFRDLYADEVIEQIVEFMDTLE